MALETNLLLSMEEVNVLQHGVMVWLLLLWRQRYWWVGWLATLAIVLGTHTACVAVRAWVQRFLNATFLERRRWHAYVHWKYEAFFVSLLTIALAGGTAGWSPRWYWAAVALGLAQLALDHQALRMAAAGKGDEQTGAVALRQGLLWIQKVLLLVLAYPAWSSFVAVLGYYFPAAAILGLSMLYLGVGLGIRLLWGLLHDYGLARVSPRFKAALDAWWHEGRDGLNRAVVVAIVAVLLVPYTFYKTWDWAPRWKGTGARFLSVLVVANVVSMEDLQRAGALLKDGLGRVFSRGRGEGKAAKAAAAAAAAENEKGQDEDAAGAADAGEDEAGADDVDDKDKMD